MIDRARSKIQECNSNKDSLIKIILQGELDVNCVKDMIYFQVNFNPDFYFVKIVDKTTYKVDAAAHSLDKSLRGEFIRQVKNDNTIPEEEKAIIIRYGLQALAGEEII